VKSDKAHLKSEILKSKIEHALAGSHQSRRPARPVRQFENFWIPDLRWAFVRFRFFYTSKDLVDGLINLINCC